MTTEVTHFPDEGQAHLLASDASEVTGYINAGGQGTRLSSIFSPDKRTGVTKALLPIGNPPISLVEHHINRMLNTSISNIVVGAGNHDIVSEHVRSTYGESEVIQPLNYEQQLGNGGDLVRAVRDYPHLFGKYILVSCVDVILDINETDMVDFHKRKDAELTIALTTRNDVPNEGAYYIGAHDEVIYCREADANTISLKAAGTQSAYRASSTGMLLANTELIHGLKWTPEDGAISIYKYIVSAAVKRGTMFGFNNGERLFTDVGTVPDWNRAHSDDDTVSQHVQYSKDKEMTNV